MSDSVWPPWTVACQASLSMGFSRQEYWSGLPCPSPGDFPNPGKMYKPVSLHLLHWQVGSLPWALPRKSTDLTSMKKEEEWGLYKKNFKLWCRADKSSANTIGSSGTNNCLLKKSLIGQKWPSPSIPSMLRQGRKSMASARMLQWIPKALLLDDVG